MGISKETKILLWSKAGGYCQNPGCHRDFFVFFGNGSISDLEELSHMIGQSKKGPRGESDLDSTERDAYENIILLCPNCHTMIDKNPSQFPVEMLRSWKLQHEEDIKNLFVTKIYKDRQTLKDAVHKLLRLNNCIFEQYGPHSSSNPLSDAAKVWQRYILSDIIPNNRKIAHMLNANENLLKREEKETLCKFVLHQQAFEYNHISGDKMPTAPLFPKAEMNNILKG